MTKVGSVGVGQMGEVEFLIFLLVHRPPRVDFVRWPACSGSQASTSDDCRLLTRGAGYAWCFHLMVGSVVTPANGGWTAAATWGRGHGLAGAWLVGARGGGTARRYLGPSARRWRFTVAGVAGLQGLHPIPHPKPLSHLTRGHHLFLPVAFSHSPVPINPNPEQASTTWGPQRRSRTALCHRVSQTQTSLRSLNVSKA
jgi:hypothetical protein